MRTLAALALTLVLSSCNRPEAEVPASAIDLAPIDHNCAFCADPGFVRTCDVAQGVSTTLYWNVADETIPRIGIFVVDDAGNDSSFAEQPARGSIQTGPWLKPGLVFKLKDPSGNVLHTVTIAGRGC